MDIPVPKDLDEEKPVVASADVPKTEEKPVKDYKKSEDSADEAQVKIAELLTSKQYHLAIKEKRTKPLLDFSLGIKKHKKNSKKKVKAKKESKPVSKNKQLLEIAVVVVLLGGSYIAIDAGIIDIGWKPPFSLFGKDDGPVTGTVDVNGNTEANK